MEILEIVSYNQNDNTTEVVFKMVNDDEDMVRIDVIENSFFDEFGFEHLAPIKEYFYDDEDENVDDEFSDYLDEDDLKTFLNEYYVVYPEKLPKPEYE